MASSCCSHNSSTKKFNQIDHGRNNPIEFKLFAHTTFYDNVQRCLTLPEQRHNHFQTKKSFFPRDMLFVLFFLQNTCIKSKRVESFDHLLELL